MAYFGVPSLSIHDEINELEWNQRSDISSAFTSYLFCTLPPEGQGRLLYSRKPQYHRDVVKQTVCKKTPVWWITSVNVKYCYIVNVKCIGHNCLTERVVWISMFSKEFNKSRVELMLCFRAWDGIVEMIQIIFLLLKQREIYLSVFSDSYESYTCALAASLTSSCNFLLLSNLKKCLCYVLTWLHLEK